jgi:citrate synthase
MSKDIEVVSTKVKKSVALSGVVAGNTAVCTVGRTGNDLHYRGYDIQGLALHATFEEVAFLLSMVTCRPRQTLKTTSGNSKACAASSNLREELGRILQRPIRWTYCVRPVQCSAASCLKKMTGIFGNRDIIDRLIASLAQFPLLVAL